MKFVIGEDGSLHPEYYDVGGAYKESPSEILDRMRSNAEINDKLNKDREERVLQLKTKRPDLYELRQSYIMRDKK